MNTFASLSEPVFIAAWQDLADKTPTHALVENVDLVIVRYGEDASVLYGRSCGYHDIGQFNPDDLTTFDWDMHKLTGVQYGGVNP